ncbi:hypothetical protein BX592_13819 [Paraburkholderia rhizosphaerae]|uniref:Uncharacterized protein n=1 Tax=Paraburkholderia rhizosphaerae TaxID=480658 RepID=A0A4R8L459_9BURK|nr:hypothetical protein BX592_13819 [Paraburkholderia rhizosphaerae]
MIDAPAGLTAVKLDDIQVTLDLGMLVQVFEV